MSLPSINFLHLKVLRYSPDKIFKLKVTTARSNQGQTMPLHTYTSKPMSLPSINFLHLMVSEIHPGQTFPSACPHARPPAHPDTMAENNTPTALKHCGVKFSKCNSLQAITDLLNRWNLKVAIAQLCNNVHVCNVTML